MIGLARDELPVDGCITKAPCGGQKAGRHDSPLLTPTLEAAKAQVGSLPEDVNVDLDRGSLGFTGEIARKGVPAPIQAGKRWVVERTHAWMNGYGKLRRYTEKDGAVVDFYPYLAAAIVTLRMLIRRATTQQYRWDSRPTTRRLK
jgi:hypothetical protein